MGNCRICGGESNRLYDGLCVACLSIEAGKEEQKRLDNENSLQGLQINTPIGNDLMNVLRFGQGNFGQVANQHITQKEKVNAEDVKVIKTDDYINIVCRPNAKERFCGTIDLSKIDGEIYGVPGDNVWYFNRLLVPEQIRHKGIATKLLNKLVEVLNNDGITLICEVNAYGDMDENNLKSLYMRFGFKDTGKGFLLYESK